jgi:peptide chain release factor 1
MKFNLDNLVSEYEDLEKKLTDSEIFKDQKKVKEVASKKKSLEQAVTLYKEYKASNGALEQNKEMLYSEKDEEMRELIKDEVANLEIKVADIEEKLKVALLPKDPNDDKNIIVEVRAGTGGDEAALFA